MVNYKEILNQIAAKLNFENFSLENFATIVLEDGTSVYASTELDLGIQVFTDEALSILLADGDYVTTEGTKFTIIDGVVGVIDNVTPVADTVSGDTVNAKKENVELASENATLLSNTIQTIFTETVDLTVNGYYSINVEVEDGIAKANFYQDVDKSVILSKTDLVSGDTSIFSTSELVDGAKIYYDGELLTNINVYTDESMTTPVPTGEYTTILGEVLTVTDGIITEIKSVIDINAELSKLVTDKDLELVDLNEQVLELSTKLEKANENYEKAKVEFAKKPVKTSVKFGETDIISNDNEDINNNRIKTGQMFKHYFK